MICKLFTRKYCNIGALLLCQNRTEPVLRTVPNLYLLQSSIFFYVISIFAFICEGRVERFPGRVVVAAIFVMFTVQLRLKVYSWPWKRQLRKQSQNKVRLVAVLVRSIISQVLHQEIEWGFGHFWRCHFPQEDSQRNSNFITRWWQTNSRPATKWTFLWSWLLFRCLVGFPPHMVSTTFQPSCSLFGVCYGATRCKDHNATN